MAGNLDLRGTVSLNVAPINSTLQSLNLKLRTLSDNGKENTLAFKRTKEAIQALGSAARAETTSVGNLTKALEAAAKVRRESLAKAADTRSGTADRRAESEARVILTTNRANSEVARQRIMMEDAAARRQSAALRDQLAVRRQELAEARAAARAAEAGQLGAFGMRYALYDVARTFSLIGGGMVAFSAITVNTAIQWERLFANVQRTVGLVGPEIADMRQEFQRLVTTLPESFEDITRVGTLAGQLGIQKDNIADFTEVVVKFATTTGVSAEETGTAFGRLNSLLPDVKNNFVGLADSIANVGVNSIATESQIIRIATQISSITNAAGLGSQETIGLAGALASIAVPPELSRGVFTRVFGQISRSISEGGINLERFGRLAGMSGAQFKAAWQSDAGDTLVKLLAGIRREGGNAEAELRALGITSVRDVPILLRLANAADSTGKAGNLLAESFYNAANAGGTLEKQYGIIADTVAAKIQVLQNNFANMLNALGEGSLGIVGDAIDGLITRLGSLSDFLNTDVGRAIGGIIVVGSALVGIFTVLGGLAAAGVAAYIALTLALQGLAGSAGASGVSMASLNAALAATGPLGAKAAAAIRVVSTALKILSVIGIALILPDITSWARDWYDSARGITKNIDTIIHHATKLNDVTVDGFLPEVPSSFIQQFAKLDQFAQDQERITANFAGMGSSMARSVKQVDDSLANLGKNNQWEKVAESLNKISADTGVGLPKLLQMFDEVDKAAGEAGVGFKQGADGMITLTDATNEALGILPAIPEELTAAQEAAQEFMEVLAGADAAFVDPMGALDNVLKGIEESAGTGRDEWEDYFNGFSVNLDDYLAELQKMVDAQTNWESNMNSLVGKVSSETLATLAEMGPEAAPLVQALVDGTTEQLGTLDTLWGQKGTEATAGFAAGLQHNNDVVMAVAAKYGEDIANQVAAAIDSDTTVEAALAALGLSLDDIPLPPVEIVAEGNVGPAMEDFDNAGAYAEALQIWFNMQGAHTQPAREDFDNAESYAEALQIWMTAHGDTKPVRSDFTSARDYGNALIAWMKAYANTDAAEAALNYAARQRTAYITQQITTAPMGNRTKPYQASDFATGGFTGQGHKYQPKGIVHAGEFVFDQSSTGALGVSFLSNLMASAKRGYAGGGSVVGGNLTQYQNSLASRASALRGGINMSSTVQLGAYERRLLMQIAQAAGVTIAPDYLAGVTTNNMRVQRRRGNG